MLHSIRQQQHSSVVNAGRQPQAHHSGNLGTQNAHPRMTAKARAPVGHGRRALGDLTNNTNANSQTASGTSRKHNSDDHPADYGRNKRLKTSASHESEPLKRETSALPIPKARVTIPVRAKVDPSKNATYAAARKLKAGSLATSSQSSVSFTSTVTAQGGVQHASGFVAHEVKVEARANSSIQNECLKTKSVRTSTSSNTIIASKPSLIGSMRKEPSLSSSVSSSARAPVSNPYSHIKAKVDSRWSSSSAKPCSQRLVQKVRSVEVATTEIATVHRTGSKSSNDSHMDIDVEPTLTRLPAFVEAKIPFFDPLLVDEYAEDIFLYLRAAETQFIPKRDYMDNQKDIDWNMRGTLINWLVELHFRLKLLPETLFLTVNLMDRLLSMRPVSALKFQLVGATALLIACKYEEVRPPSVSVIVYYCGNTYTTDDILRAERFMLGVLKFNIGYTGPLEFFRRLTKADEYDPQSRTLSKYLMESTLPFEAMIQYGPSLVAASSLYLARKILSNADWTADHISLSGYTEAEIIPCAQTIFSCVSCSERNGAVFQKYSLDIFQNVATFTAAFIAHISR
ncbi:hypothetical protein HDU76_002383 [Blyttiomyces sp. JEL0837]|nr:hypothetical protein HDU76_002383 [Blyttiomyces sp. JEL0837]